MSVSGFNFGIRSSDPPKPRCPTCGQLLNQYGYGWNNVGTVAAPSMAIDMVSYVAPTYHIPDWSE